MGRRFVLGGALPQGRRLAAGHGGLVRRGRPVHQRIRRVGVPGQDLPAAAGVPGPDRGAGADVRTAVRGGAGPARGRRGPGRAGQLEPAAGAAGPAGAVVPLPSPVPGHAARRARTRGARPGPGTAAPRRRLVPAPRPARGCAGVLHGRGGRRGGRPPDRWALCSDLQPSPDHDASAMVAVAGRPGRHRGTPDRCRIRLDPRRGVGTPGRGRAVGRCGRSAGPGRFAAR